MKPSLYLDEDVASVYVTMLEKQGFSTVATDQMGNSGKSDAIQLTYCIENGLVLITHNIADFSDLSKLVLTSGGHHCGIIGIHQLDRHRTRRTIGDISKRLLEHINGKDSNVFQDIFQVIA
jgi:predicted nuclease of predicted toxin-antitoxin system